MVSTLTVVHVRDDAGVDHEFTPDDELPMWAVIAIDNPKALDSDARTDAIAADEQTRTEQAAQAAADAEAKKAEAAAKKAADAEAKKAAEAK